MNLIKGIMILSFGAITLSATWFVGGHDLGEMPQKREFVSISNGGDLDDSQAMRDGVGVRLFGMGSEATPSFREMNALLLSAAPGEVVKDRDDAGDMFVRLPPGGGGESPFILDDNVSSDPCVMTNIFGKIHCGDCNIGDTFTIEGDGEDGSITYVVASREVLKNAIDSGLSLNGFCTSKITDMSGLFYNVSAQPTVPTYPIQQWDTSSVLYMDKMFKDSYGFSNTIKSWDTGSVLSACEFGSNSSLPYYKFPTLPESMECLSGYVPPEEGTGGNGNSESCSTGSFNGYTITCGGCPTGSFFTVDIFENGSPETIIVASEATLAQDITNMGGYAGKVCTSNITTFENLYYSGGTNGTGTSFLSNTEGINSARYWDTSGVISFDNAFNTALGISTLDISRWSTSSGVSGCFFANQSDMPYTMKRKILNLCDSENQDPR